MDMSLAGALEDWNQEDAALAQLLRHNVSVHHVHQVQVEVVHAELPQARPKRLVLSRDALLDRRGQPYLPSSLRRLRMQLVEQLAELLITKGVVQVAVVLFKPLYVQEIDVCFHWV
eukprot:6175514-Pleurochrysis_carterae.AAC.3